MNKTLFNKANIWTLLVLCTQISPSMAQGNNYGINTPGVVNNGAFEQTLRRDYAVCFSNKSSVPVSVSVLFDGMTGFGPDELDPTEDIRYTKKSGVTGQAPKLQVYWWNNTAPDNQDIDGRYYETGHTRSNNCSGVPTYVFIDTDSHTPEDGKQHVALIR